MKTNKIIAYGFLAAIFVLAFTALSLTGCPTDDGNGNNNSGSGNNPITYTVTQTGGARGTADSTGIVFTFSASVGSLTAADITVSGAAAKGADATLTGSGTIRTLAPITVNAAGLATVSITKSGIEAASKNVTVHKAGQATPEYWSITWNLNGGTAGGAYPTQIVKGAVLAKPSDPAKANSVFGGWYTNSGLTRTYNFVNPVTANLTLYAKWETGQTAPSHTHQWGAWTATEIAGTEERVCTTNTAHIEARLTGTGRFTFQAFSGAVGYSVSKGTAVIGTVRIPAYYRPSDELEYQPVMGIGDFSYCTSLTAITIPDSVTSIGGGAFSGCSILADITIPEGITSIGESAFSNTAWLNNQSGGLVYAGKVLYTYKGTMPANTVINNIRADTIAIADIAFYGCTGLTSVTVPASVTSIGETSDYYISGAFRDCTSLTSVTFVAGSQLESIGNGTFSGCTSLTSITIPASVTEISGSSFGYYSGGAFSGCTNLTSVTFVAGSQLESIGNGTFSGCSSLTSITIPASVTSIGGNAFYSCTGLASITVDASNPNYASQDGILYNKAKTEFVLIPGAISGSVTIPASVTSINNGAFSDCTGLTSITIPAGVTEIGNWAFSGCTGLTSITIPASVTSIGSRAFSGCNSLTSVTFEGTLDYLYGAFDGDLAYIYNGPGTYTTANPGWDAVWTKQ